MLRIGGRDFLLADGRAAKPQPPEPPYADFLTTKKMAKEQVLFSFKPNKSDQYDNIKITLQGYQWAKLTIDLPDSKATVKAANGLTPTVRDELKTGESVETVVRSVAQPQRPRRASRGMVRFQPMEKVIEKSFSPLMMKEARSFSFSIRHEHLHDTSCSFFVSASVTQGVSYLHRTLFIDRLVQHLQQSILQSCRCKLPSI